MCSTSIITKNWAYSPAPDLSQVTIGSVLDPWACQIEAQLKSSIPV